MEAKQYFWSIVIFFTSIFGAQAQAVFPQVQIIDKSTHKPIVNATVFVQDHVNQKILGIRSSNGEGTVQFEQIKSGKYLVTISHLHYRAYHAQTVWLDGTKQNPMRIYLEPFTNTIEEVVVTAQQDESLFNTTTISKDAIKHIQPTSFTDILALLPGGRSSDPNMGSMNAIKLRQSNLIRNSSNQNYDISSLGTSFVVDGSPILTDANLQIDPLAYGTNSKYIAKNTVNRGVDMRTIGTDDIDSVEIIRGIPSVQYGEMTSGVVNIHRKSGLTGLEARIKVDEYGRLLALGKGLSLGKNNTLNADIAYLDSRIDPRVPMENYKRFTPSLRFKNQHITSTWASTHRLNLDYTGTIESVRKDPEVLLEGIDTYKSTYDRVNFNYSAQWRLRKQSFLKDIELTASGSYEKNELNRQLYVSITRDTPVPNSSTEGEHDAEALPFSYLADYRMTGKPTYLFVQARSNYGYKLWGNMQNLLIGADWNFSKNLGDGEVYDISRPLNPSWPTRPRPFHEIPASQKLALFAEQTLQVPVHIHRLALALGVRATTIPGIDRQYALRDKIFAEPRFNGLLHFRNLRLANETLHLSVGGGAGIAVKMPTVSMLYPQKSYNEMIELNYWHPNPSYRRIRLRTYITDRTNHELMTAKNYKWELRTNIAYRVYKLNVTYFNEKIHTGFRNISVFQPFYYKKYDPYAIDSNQLQGPPDITNLPYQDMNILDGYTLPGNGSALYKEGVEYQLETPRSSLLRTKLTVFGAWFKTTYTNSEHMMIQPSIVIAEEIIGDKYVGIYEGDAGNVNTTFNTNLMLDTQVPRIGLIFSTTAEFTWLRTERLFPQNGTPIGYLDSNGVSHRFTEQDAQDSRLQHLIKKYNNDESLLYLEVPLGMNINFKARKQIGKSLDVSLFVNRIFNYYKDYYRLGTLIRRNTDSYFGMEISIRL